MFVREEGESDPLQRETIAGSEGLMIRLVQDEARGYLTAYPARTKQEVGHGEINLPRSSGTVCLGMRALKT